MAPFEDPGVRPNIIRQGSVFCLTKSPKIAFFCSMLTFQTEKVIVYPKYYATTVKTTLGIQGAFCQVWLSIVGVNL